MSEILDTSNVGGQGLKSPSAANSGEVVRKRAKGSAAIAVAAGILASRVFGLVRGRVFAHYLGNSDAAGAFGAALRIPNLLQNLFGEGVLSASFIPVYARLRAEGRDREAVEVAGTVASMLLLLVVILTSAGVLAARPLIEILAPGFQGDVRELTIRIVQIMFPGVGLLVLSAWCLGVLNSHKKFFLSYIAPVLWNVAIIATFLIFGGSLLSSRPGQMHLAELVAWGTVVGAALQLALQLPQALRFTKGLRPSLTFAHPHVRKVLSNFVPVVVTRGVVQLSAYVDQIIASYLGPALVAGMGFAQTLYMLPVSLFGMAISAAELPAMSSVTGQSDQIAKLLREKLVAGLRRIEFFVVPSVVAFVLLGDVIVALIYKTGQFRADDVRLVWVILGGSAVGLLASTQGRLCATALWALHDTRTPLRFAIIRVVITAFSGFILAIPVRQALHLPPVFGAAALTASAGVAGWIEYLLLERALKKRIAAFSVGIAHIARLWLAALFAAGLAYGVKLILPISAAWLRGLLILGIYGIAYLGATSLLGFREARDVLRRVLRLRA